jgi:uncharacterized protein (DUF1330 family)
MTQPAHTFIRPTESAGAALAGRQIRGEFVMLNLLRFREIADYSLHPDLAPEQAISGRQAYEIYMQHTAPFLHAAGGSLLYAGSGGEFFVGPPGGGWDMVLLVKQQSIEAFFAFANDAGYLAGHGHREAALSDSRLLPLTDLNN